MIHPIISPRTRIMHMHPRTPKKGCGGGRGGGGAGAAASARIGGLRGQAAAGGACLRSRVLHRAGRLEDRPVGAELHRQPKVAELELAVLVAQAAAAAAAASY
jgi:hypothetical protein